MLKGPSNAVEGLEVKPHCHDEEGVVEVWSECPYRKIRNAKILVLQGGSAD